MMKKSKSNPWMKSKALYLIPVAALALSAFATPKFVAPIEETVNKLEGKGKEKSLNLQAFEEERKVVELKNVSKVLVDGKEMTTQEAMEAVKGKEIQNSLTTQPDGSEVLSIKTRGTKDGQPLIVLDGKIIEVSKDVNFETMNSEEQFSSLLNINVEDIESITVLKNDAATKVWGDKGANGVIVITTKSKDDVKELIKKLPGAEIDDGNIKVNGKSVVKITLNDKEVFNNNDTIYNVLKERAKFPGGDSEIFKFLSENVRYPKLCHEFGVQGCVIVRFVVEKDGSITHIEKVRGVENTLSEAEVMSYKQEHPDSPEQLKAGQDLGDLLFGEAKRVMELMPKWESAKDKDGNAVRSFYSLPFTFRLQ